MSKKKVGRKTKLTIEQVNNLIYLFKTEKEPNGAIKYIDMYRFNKELVQQERFPILASEDFWRKKGRLGRKIIDEANNIFSPEKVINNIPDDKIPNLLNLVKRKYDDYSELQKELIAIESKFYNNVKYKNKLETKLTKQEEQLNEYKKKLTDMENKYDYLQDLLFKLLRYSTSEDVPITNHLDTGKKQTKIVKKALENMFHDPISFYNWIEEKENETYKDSSNEKVINLKDKKSLADEFSDIF